MKSNFGISSSWTNQFFFLIGLRLHIAYNRYQALPSFFLAHTLYCGCGDWGVPFSFGVVCGKSFILNSFDAVIIKFSFGLTMELTWTTVYLVEVTLFNKITLHRVFCCIWFWKIKKRFYMTKNDCLLFDLKNGGDKTKKMNERDRIKVQILVVSRDWKLFYRQSTYI